MVVDLARQFAGVQSPVDRLQQGITFGQEQADRQALLDEKQIAKDKTKALNDELAVLSQNPSSEELRAFTIRNPAYAASLIKPIEQLDAETKKNTITEMLNIYSAVAGGEVDTVIAMLERKKQAAINSGDKQAEATATVALETAKNNPDSLKTVLGLQLSGIMGDDFDNIQTQIEGRKVGFEEAFHESLKEGKTVDQQEKADLIALGLVPKASNVKIIKQGGLYGKADPATNEFVPLTDAEGNTIKVSDVAKGEATVEEAKTFAKAKGASRNKFIDEGATTIQKIHQNNRNIDLAVDALEKGAATGFVQSFFPSIRSASVELGNVRNRLGLDVIGSVRFGALSEGERAMAMETAIPTDMLPADLTDWLQRKKVANNKMLGYFGEQIDFLSEGGDIAGFMKKKEAELKNDQSNLPEGAKVIKTLSSGARVIELSDGTKKVLE